MNLKVSRKDQKLESTSYMSAAKRAKLTQHSFSSADLSSWARLLRCPAGNSRSQKTFQPNDGVSNHGCELNRFKRGGPAIDFQTPFTEFEQSTQTAINTLRSGTINVEPNRINSNQKRNEEINRHFIRFFVEPQVNRLNDKLDARAFTIGQDIFLHSNAVGNTNIVEHEINHANENNGSIVYFWRDLERVIRTMRAGLNETPPSENELREVLSQLIRSAERGFEPIDASERQEFFAEFTDFPQRLADCLIRMGEADNLSGSFRDSQEAARHYLRYWLDLIYSHIRVWSDLEIQQEIGQAYARVIVAPPLERRLDELESDLVIYWREYWEDQDDSVEDTKTLALYILDRYWELLRVRGVSRYQRRSSVPEHGHLSALGFQPSLSVHGAWYQSLDIVDSSLGLSADQVAQRRRDAIDNFWDPLADTQRSSLETLLEQALAAQIATNAIGGSQEEASRVGQQIVRQMRANVGHWSVVYTSLAPTKRIRVNAIITCYQNRWQQGNPCSVDQCRTIGLEIPATRVGSPMRVREVESSEVAPPSRPSGCGCAAPGGGGSDSGLIRLVRLLLGIPL